MKQCLRLICVLLVLLMTVSLIAACGNKDDKEDPKETQKETERETEAETEQDLSEEELDKLKGEISDAIIDALGNAEQTTQPETTAPQEETTEYAGVVEGLLGSLGGLGNGEYNYTEMIGEVLDLYIGTDSRSEFIKGLVKMWIQNKLDKHNQTAAPDTEEQTTQEQLPEDDEESLQEFIAKQTAEAVASEIVDRINETVGSKIYDSIYEAVYNAMKSDKGYTDGILEELIPGYGQLSGLLGGLGQ